MLGKKLRAAGGGFYEWSLVDTDASNLAALASYTLTGATLGDAVSNRVIYLAISIQFDDEVGTNDVSSVTVGGVTATKILGYESTLDSRGHVYFYQAAVPTGATGDVVVTTTENMDVIAIGVHRGIGYSTTASDTFTSSADSDDISLTASANNSVVLAAMQGNGDNAVCTYSNLTVDASYSSGDSLAVYSNLSVDSGAYLAEVLTNSTAHSSRFALGAVIFSPA